MLPRSEHLACPKECVEIGDTSTHGRVVEKGGAWKSGLVSYEVGDKVRIESAGEVVGFVSLAVAPSLVRSCTLVLSLLSNRSTRIRYLAKQDVGIR